jgi:hypothetical protein
MARMSPLVRFTLCPKTKRCQMRKFVILLVGLFLGYAVSRLCFSFEPNIEFITTIVRSIGKIFGSIFGYGEYLNLVEIILVNSIQTIFMYSPMLLIYGSFAGFLLFKTVHKKLLIYSILAYLVCLEIYNWFWFFQILSEEPKFMVDAIIRKWPIVLLRKFIIYSIFFIFMGIAFLLINKTTKYNKKSNRTERYRGDSPKSI